MELQPIQSKIYEIRGQRVMLDRDLAEVGQPIGFKRTDGKKYPAAPFDDKCPYFILALHLTAFLPPDIESISRTKKNRKIKKGDCRHFARLRSLRLWGCYYPPHPKRHHPYTSTRKQSNTNTYITLKYSDICVFI